MYRAAKRGYALVALGAHLSEAEQNFHCFNTTWPPEAHIELPEVGSQYVVLGSPRICPLLYMQNTDLMRTPLMENQS